MTIGITLLAGCVLAAALPDFSGEWKMNRAKSNFTPLPAPDSLVRNITHHDPRLHIVTTQSGQQRDVVTELDYTTDGKECKNTIRGQEVTGTAKWDGDKLVIDSRRVVQGLDLHQTETWSLASDGKAMTIVNHVEGPQGAFDITIVLDKQGGH